MNTPAHLIFGLAAFGKPDAPKVNAAALAGGLLPDLSLYLLAGTHLAILGTDPEVVFGQLYYSDAWQSIFRIDNSAVLWGIGLAFALALRSAWAVAFCGAALLHIGLDLPFHVDDGRAHFWPITNWIFESPVSYWDPNHYGDIVGSLEIGVALALCILMWKRYRSTLMRALIGLLAVMEALPAILFAIMFAGS